MDQASSGGGGGEAAAGREKKSKSEQIIDEIMHTEMSYVKDLSEIINGYQTPIIDHMDTLKISEEDILALFNNIEEMRDFNQAMLTALTKCRYNIKEVANTFITMWENADVGLKIYSDYCSVYPKTVEVLTKCMKTPVVSMFFKTCQMKMGHMLPLGAYLIKPVQRVLKYYLLLEQLNKCVKPEEDGKEEMKAASSTMTQVAEHINEVKKSYETSLLVQEIQSQLIGWEGNDLLTYGDLVEQGTFKFLGSKTSTAAIHLATERHLLLFEGILMITKKKEDQYVYQNHIIVDDLQTDGRIARFPLCFELYDVSRDKAFVFIANTLDEKLDWVKQVDKIVERKIHMGLTDRTKLLLFAGIHAGRGPDDVSQQTSNTTTDAKQFFSEQAGMELHYMEQLKKQKKAPPRRTSKTYSHAPINFEPRHLPAEDKEPPVSQKELKKKRFAATGRSQSVLESIDRGLGGVTEEKISDKAVNEEYSRKAQGSALQRKKLVKKRKVSAPPMIGNPFTSTNDPSQTLPQNTNNSSSKEHTNNLGEDQISELGGRLADQQLTDDLLSEMRPREPSIVLPPPSQFTSTTEDQDKITTSPATASSTGQTTQQNHRWFKTRSDAFNEDTCKTIYSDDDDDQCDIGTNTWIV
ncbi:pleckstrin homology domain-containing family G member 3-like isoform X2 [Dysidea avara]|uniref:pleckstrin homology domain-containing family G member 3-like isoform X2 n=1 Tax=Dysidea avara TaxID=196820 RepID=UPI00332F55D4